MTSENENAMPPIDFEREKIMRAKAMSPEQKLRAGLELFDLNRALIIAALKVRHPEADDATINALFLERLALVRRLEARP